MLACLAYLGVKKFVVTCEQWDSLILTGLEDLEVNIP